MPTKTRCFPVLKKNEGYNYGHIARIEEGRTIYSAVAVPPFEYSYIKLYLFENRVNLI